MAKKFRPYQPTQSLLFPPSPVDWLPEGHLAFFIMDLVKELDLSEIYAPYERELRGYPPHDPGMMTALLLYAYAVGLPSSRMIERKTWEDVAFRVVAGGTHPDHSAISEFRRRHLEALSGLFVQVLRLCQKAGLVRLGHVSLDGTKLKANASKHKAMSYGRMKKTERELAQKVERMLSQAEKMDVEEDARYGKDKRGDEIPGELGRASERLARIRKLKAQLEAEAAEQAKAGKGADSRSERNGPDDDPPPSGGDDLPSHKVRAYKDGTPKDKAQRNLTDPESRIQKTRDGFIQGYNAQAVVDDAHQVIVAQALTNQPPDVEHFEPLMRRAVEGCGRPPKQASLDNGYWSAENVEAAIAMGIDVYIATGRPKHGEKPIATRGPLPKDATPKQRMARKLSTKKGQAIYARRKCIVEPVFGQIKGARGLRQLLLRGLTKARGEWSLHCLTHNLLKLHRAAVATA